MNDNKNSAGISIHTTRKVVTSFIRVLEDVFPNFNPHHPQGGDLYSKAVSNVFNISIHTTRKVVTPPRYPLSYNRTISIHTTRKVVTLL